MAKDTVSLRLSGEIPIGLFAGALEHLGELLKALSEEIVGQNDIEWQVIHLQSGSAWTTVRGLRAELYDVEKVVHAYAVVGQALEQHRPIPYSEDVAKNAIALTSFINGHIKAVEFVTDEATSVVSEPILQEEQAASKRYSIGTVDGTVNAIWYKPRLKLALYDPLFDRVVYCYLSDDQEDLARQVWRSRVRVSGMIFRDPETGRPIEVRPVKSVERIESAPQYSFRRARGVLPWQEGDEPAEVAIRRARDAG